MRRCELIFYLLDMMLLHGRYGWHTSPNLKPHEKFRENFKYHFKKDHNLTRLHRSSCHAHVASICCFKGAVCRFYTSSSWNANSNKTLTRLLVTVYFMNHLSVKKKKKEKSGFCVPLGAELLSGPEKKCKQKPEMEKLV